ncbi:MAG: hypothetical protein GY913_13130 [Proteobacteria bacterium]|nr:hypothetical protein [Pseudomonadota bacterium]MCP4917850.1 hypothetical protein [Pseudomonadota bacterium]
MWVLHPDLGSASRIDRAFERITTYDVGVAPAAVVDTQLGPVFTVRGERSVVRLEAEGETHVQVGAEPVGLVATPDFLFVAVSGERQVVMLDGQSLGLVRSFEIDASPEWLTLVDDTLFITARDRLFRLDLPSEEVTEVPLPTLETFDPTLTRVVPSHPRVTAPPRSSVTASC